MHLLLTYSFLARRLQVTETAHLHVADEIVCVRLHRL